VNPDPVTVTDFLPALATGVTALVAGGIALLIHRQRLRHEREEADLTLVRNRLAEGAELADRIVQAARRHLLVPGDPDYAAYRRDVGDSAENTGAYGMRLRVLFVEGHEVMVAWAALVESAAVLTDTLIAAAKTQQEEGRVDRTTVEDEVERVDAAVRSWTAAATRVGRARLRQPCRGPRWWSPRRLGFLRRSRT
jgi:hypothetical protein